MAVHDVHKSDAQGTSFRNFEPKREKRVGLNSEGTFDENTGSSPLTRWIARAFSYADAVSTDGTGMLVQLQLSAGTIVDRCIVRLDTAFTGTVGTGLDSVEIGDGDQASGWAAAIDLTQTAPAVIFDSDAVYNAGDASAGATGPQYYQNGDTVDIVLASTDDLLTGEAIVFLRTISYCEAPSAEW